MLRRVVLLLLLANGLFFAWAQGWLAPVMPPRADPREPERLAAQVRPELITVLTPKAASDAVATAASSSATGAAGSAAAAGDAEPPPLCLEAGPFTDTTVAAAETALSQSGVPDGAVKREAVALSFTYGVVMGRFADRDTLRAKAEELKKLGVRSDEISAPPALVPGLRLGNYSDRYGAESALANLAKKGVRTARVAPLPTGPLQQWLRADKADAELQTRLKSLPGDKLGGGFKACTPKPGRL
jgi:endonuclease YncB( thermonuclease family)